MDNMIFEDHFTHYAIYAYREYQEIHPYSVVNIDSVKINTSLIMMKECFVLSLVKEKLEHLQCEQASYDIKQREYKIF